jgi:hypothetical protein
MLVMRVQAVGCKIAGGKVVGEVIKWRDDGVAEQGVPCDWVIAVEGGIKVNGDEGSQESR